MTNENHLIHYGILRRSGRYPWGSGSTQNIRNKTFLDTVDGLRKDGLSETEIARGFGITTTQLRAAKSIAVSQQRQSQINMAQRLKDKGYSNVAIGNRMGINESSVRSLLAPGQKYKADLLESTANMLRDQVNQKSIVDIGKGVELSIGLTQNKLQTAVAILQEEGYTVHQVKVPQIGTSDMTTIKVLAKPGVTAKEVWNNRYNIQQITDHTSDLGKSFTKLRPPTSVSSKKIKINYDEDGGSKADGVIYIRPGVKDLSLGHARYAQVRIAVDNTHYLKGMAVYKDDLPDGIDIVFNTNKSNTGNKLDALKPLQRDPKDESKIDFENPFGATIKPGGQRGHLNIINEEGDWDNWSKSLPSQMLSKQSPDLAKTQLNVTYERRRAALEEITSLTNPSVRKKLLQSYADDVDSAAVHLKAAALPRQATKVILPVKSIKDGEIYAPGLRNGERVALVRFPHGGKFEIPELVVNNRNAEAKKLLGTDARDAVGIHHKVAERLSGADFDGDSVLVIPNNRGLVKSDPALDGLKNFDPRAAYPGYPGMTKISPENMQKQMGRVTNLIADMTIKGANSQELARAVRHSMVVIDSEKHGLDWKSSERDNGILQLKQKYQGGTQAGASTLITRATSEARVPKRKPRPASQGGPIDKETGKKVFVETGETYVNSKGVLVKKTEKTTKLALVDDANVLSSGTPIERVYAEHSNKLKALGNTARKELVSTKPIAYSPSARTAYLKEVKSLDNKLSLAQRNAPLERQAQLIANAVVSAKRKDNPNLDPKQLKKIKYQALADARARTGAGKQRIIISDKEWEAIQAGAISAHKLDQILTNSDLDRVKELATPRKNPVMTKVKEARATALLNAGYSLSEVADDLGVPVSTLTSNIGRQQ